MVSGSRDHSLAMWKIPSFDMNDDSLSFSYGGIMKSWSEADDIQPLNEYLAPVHQVSAHSQAVRALKLHPQSQNLISISFDGTAKIWDKEQLSVVSS